MSKPFFILIWVLNSLPLLVYPFLLIFSILVLSGWETGKTTALGRVAVVAFYSIMLPYPVVWLFSLIMALCEFRKGHREALIYSWVPLAHMILAGCAFLGIGLGMT